MHTLTEKIKSEFFQYRSLFLVVFTFCMVATLSFFTTSNMHRSSATSLSGFSAGNIISDAVMSNYSSMSERDIQDFLDAKNQCNNHDYDLYLQYTSSKPNITWHWEGEPYDGHFVCLAEEKFGETASEIGTGKTAARIIYEAAQANHINPQALIALIQKESSLITDKVPNSFDYGQATGYGCPDNSTCDKKYSGFSNQVHRAAELFRYILDHNSTYYPAGHTVYVGYHPNSSCGGTQVYIENRATAALYQYTPYQPNASALSAGYGQGDSCSAYGNRNFYLYFTDWFGSTQAAVDEEQIVITDGEYSLISYDDDALTVSAGNAELTTRSLTNITKKEHWSIERDASGYYRIINSYTEQPLVVATTEIEIGTNVKVGNSSTCAQQWKIYRTQDNYLIFESACSSGMVLEIDSSGDAKLGLSQKNHTAQKWQLHATTELPSGVYNISSAIDAEKNLGSTTTNTTNGVNVQLQNANPAWQQQWQLNYDSVTGFYTIKNYKTKTILDIANGTTANGTNVQLWSSNGSCAQKWKIVTTDTGYAIVSACHDSFVLDLDNGSIDHGTNLQIWRTNNTSAERWEITPAVQLEDGLYTISAKKDPSKLIDLSDSRDRRGNNVQLWSNNDSWSQKWHLQYNSSDDTYTIINAGAGNNVIDIHNSWISQGTNIKLWSSNGSCAQKWILEPTIDGSYIFISSCNRSYALDLDNGSTASGTNVQLWANNNTDAQKWQLTPTELDDTDQLLPNGTYTIVSKVNNKMGLDVANADNYNGVNVQLWSLNDTWAQDWNLQYNELDDTYTFISTKASNRVLDINNGEAKRLTNVQIWSSNKTCAQKWHLTLARDGYYTIASACDPTYVIDLENGLSYNGSNIRLWEDNNSDAQRWKLNYK